MTGEKVKSVFQEILNKINENQFFAELPAMQMNEKLSALHCGQLTSRVLFSHLKFMCLEAQKFVDEQRIEKAMRWLGFVQAVTWNLGIYTLDDLKNQSRPDSKDEDGKGD